MRVLVAFGLGVAAAFVACPAPRTVSQRQLSRQSAVAITPEIVVTQAPQTLPLSAKSVPLTDEQKRMRRVAAAELSVDVFVVGLSHHNAAVETREKLAIPEAEWSEAARDIVASSNGDIAEAAVLSTCNRFEVYFSAKDARRGFAAASRYFQRRSGLPMATLRDSLFMLSYDHASRHALRVASGLDSLIVGEGQILSQMKSCYANAVDEGGAGGKVTTRLINAAVAAGKRARDETNIAKGAVSISSAAYELIDDRLKRDAVLGHEGPRSLKEVQNIVIVGAGKMTRLLLIHMASHGVTKGITLLNRSAPKAEELKKEFAESYGCEIDVVTTGGDNAVVLEAMQSADVVFTSTSSESYVVHASDFDTRRREKPLAFVDISVPRNVDPACSDVPGVVAYDVDSLKAVVEKNTAKRQREIVEAEKLLDGEVRSFRGWLDSLDAVPAITKLQKKAEDLRVAEMKRANAKLAHLSPREIEAVERLSRGIVSKLLHGPMAALRDGNAAPAKKSPLSLVKNMFKI